MRATPFSNEELEAIVHLDSRDDVPSDQFGNTGNDLAQILAQEVLYMRNWMAYIGRTVEAQCLDVKALGKGRRRILREAVIRLRTLALGHQLGWPRDHGRGSHSEFAGLRRLGEPYAKDYVGDLTDG